MKKLLFVVLLLFMAVLTTHADDLRGYIVPEYYLVGSHHTGEEGLEGQHGFWLKRIFFGYNTDLGSGWSAQLRFEMNSTAFEEGLVVPYVKNVNVKKDIGGGAALLLGIIEPPSFDRIEKFWNYRFIEKTAPDFFKMASSRDFGLALDGKTKGGLVYTVMYGNYSAHKSEDNKGKGIYARLGWESQYLYLEANGYYAADNGTDYTYLAFFGGLKGGWGRLGLGYYSLAEQPEAGERNSTGVISAFGTFNFGKKTEAFVRCDYFTGLALKDPGEYIPVPATQFKTRFAVAGLNFKVHDMIRFSPNIKYVFYDGDGAPGGDFYFTLSAYIEFKTKIGKE